jgi:prepilin-type N-terminal cleavage/methylation domain-containing protein
MIQAPQTHARGFTLIELMIAMALMILIMVGVGYVFKLTGQTVGATQAISTAVREADSAQATMSKDFSAAITNPDEAPAFIIDSTIRGAFKSLADQQTDLDYNPASSNVTKILSIDLNGNNIEGESSVTGEQISNATYNFRNHRLDRVSFFVRGNYHRQTGNTGVYVDDLGSNEAYVTYGHLWLYDGVSPSMTATASYTDPRLLQKPTATNPNPNWYATDWILGRHVMLLRQPDSVSGQILDNAGTPQTFYMKSASAATSLNAGVKDTQNANTLATTDAYLMQSSRYDLAGTSIATERTDITTYCEQNSAATSNPPQWFGNLNIGFWANPLFLRPLDSPKLAQTTPIFMPHCTQFMVEYAGDYLKQDPTTGQIMDVCGYVTAAADVSSTDNTNIKTITNSYTGTTDGVTDFIVNPTTHEHSIRWYGMPRDTDGDGHIIVGGAGVTSNTITDVVPLRDIIMSSGLFGAGVMTCAPMERVIPRFPPSNDYTSVPTGGMLTGAEYLTAWGPTASYGYNLTAVPPSEVPHPPLPTMIRIVFTLDDPNGRLARDGQTFTYVFKLQ